MNHPVAPHQPEEDLYAFHNSNLKDHRKKDPPPPPLPSKQGSGALPFNASAEETYEETGGQFDRPSFEYSNEVRVAFRVLMASKCSD